MYTSKNSQFEGAYMRAFLNDWRLFYGLMTTDGKVGVNRLL